MKKVQSVTLFLTLIMNSVLFAASDTHTQWYQVDLIVFRYSENNSGENWPAVTNERSYDRPIKLTESLIKDDDINQASDMIDRDYQSSSYHEQMNRAFVSLPLSEMQLNDQASRLNSSTKYQVITQKAWRMPVDSESDQYPIEIRDAIIGQETLLLDGIVSISESNFIHVDVDLWLNIIKPKSSYASYFRNKTQKAIELIDSYIRADNWNKLYDGTDLIYITDNFRIKQRRRIRNSSELQYIDSPEIGVILKVTPLR